MSAVFSAAPKEMAKNGIHGVLRELQKQYGNRGSVWMKYLTFFVKFAPFPFEKKENDLQLG